MIDSLDEDRLKTSTTTKKKLFVEPPQLILTVRGQKKRRRPNDNCPDPRDVYGNMMLNNYPLIAK